VTGTEPKPRILVCRDAVTL